MRQLKLYALRILPLAGVGLLLGTSIAASQMDPVTLPWPKHELTVRDTTPHRVSTQLAVTQWNLSRVGLRFRLVEKGPADVVIRIGTQSQCDQQGCGAHASWIGYRGHSESISLMFLPVPGRQNKVDYDTARVISHELGHIAGLEHTTTCGLMANDLYKACDIDPLSTPRLCGPDDRSIRLLRRMYGGSGTPGFVQGCTSLKRAISGLESYVD